MIDLNKMVNESLKKIEEEGYVQEVIDNTIKKTIESVIDDLLRSWSPFGKNLKEEIENKLNIDLKNLDIASYNQLILNAVKEKLDVVIHQQGIEQIKADMDELLANKKSEYRLSEIIKKLKKDNAEDAIDDDWYEISLHIEKGSVLNFIYFDGEPEKRKHECKYKIITHPEDERIHSIEINDRQFDNKLIMGGLRGIEKELFIMYTHKAKLIIDDENIDTEYGYDDDDDY